MIKRDQVGECLANIYRSEIPIRLEWVYDGGFTWSLIKQGRDQWPRVWNDDSLGGDSCSMQTDTAARLADQGQFLRKDWLERGSAETIEAAMTELLEAIKKHHPNFNTIN